MICADALPRSRFSSERQENGRNGTRPSGGPNPGRGLAGAHVVIVEDEGITQLQLRKILTQAGLIVAGTAPNGALGIDVVLDTKPDLVLMDIKMPVMDGLEAASRILAAESMCIVMLTAYSDPEYVLRAQALGVAGYVTKPFTTESLLPELEAAYDRFHEKPN